MKRTETASKRHREVEKEDNAAIVERAMQRVNVIRPMTLAEVCWLEESRRNIPGDTGPKKWREGVADAA